MLKTVSPNISSQTFFVSSGFFRFLNPSPRITSNTRNLTPTMVWLRVSSGLTELCSPTKMKPAISAVKLA